MSDHGLRSGSLDHFGPITRKITMSDDLTNKGPKDRTRVNTSEDWEVKYWTKEFGVTEAELKAAVKAVGPMVVDVRKKLGK
jgi:hypothetical protein